MSAVLGNSKKAYIKVSSSYTWLGAEQSNSFNMTAEAIETSDKSTEWAQFISGKKGATIELSVFADNTDGAQAAAISALMAGTVVDWAIGTVTASAVSAGDYGKAIVTSVSDSNDFGAVASRTISLQVTGPVTHV